MYGCRDEIRRREGASCCECAFHTSSRPRTDPIMLQGDIATRTSTFGTRGSSTAHLGVRYNCARAEDKKGSCNESRTVGAEAGSNVLLRDFPL